MGDVCGWNAFLDGLAAPLDAGSGGGPRAVGAAWNVCRWAGRLRMVVKSGSPPLLESEGTDADADAAAAASSSAGASLSAVDGVAGNAGGQGLGDLEPPSFIDHGLFFCLIMLRKT